MGRIRDYACSYDNASGLGQWTEKNPALRFPDCYQKHQQIVSLAQTIRRHNEEAFCILPFCHTLEAEALGAKIHLGDGQTGPRARTYSCTELRNVLDLTMDHSAIRLRETLEAVKLLKRQGENVLFQLSGPMTILNSLLPSEVIFRSLLKEVELLLQVFQKLGQASLQLMKLAEEAGADAISYADPLGAVNLIGPKAAERIAKGFTADFLKQMDARLKTETLVFLCPKTALALTGTELAVWKEHPLDASMKYCEGARQFQGQIRFCGQSCINKTNYTTNNILEVKIL